jgi:transposase
MTLKVLAQKGHSRREIARLLGVDESTVRYHLSRISAGARDGRADQQQLAAGWSGQVTHYIESVGGGPLNLADLHDWLVAEHEYPGSLRSVERFYRKHYPKPARRARRRVETPPGAQAQADWAEWPRVSIGGRLVYAYEFHLKLSHSRFSARVWAPRKNQLSWHAAHNEAFRRLDGIPATVRVDNEKTAVSKGAGSWGELNPSYKRYARAVRFHIDACAPRSPQAKGKVERGIRTARGARAITDHDWESWEELQAWTDARSLSEAERRVCPATGTSVLEAWEAEKYYLSPVPLLPEPFDVVLMRTVSHDCLVAFEGRQYSVPFAYLGRRVEVRGCARLMQVVADGEVIAAHPRYGRERIVIDPSHYEGENTDSILAPIPLGRMGRRLQEIARMTPEQRPLDLYAALAEVAR